MMDWFQTFKDWWWLVGVFGALIGTLIKYTVRIHKATEALTQVAKHDQELKELKQNMGDMSNEMTGLRKDLSDHASEQKRDIQHIHETLYSILDALLKLNDNPADVAEAHKKLRRHNLEK